jgi:peptide chain release factor
VAVVLVVSRLIRRRTVYVLLSGHFSPPYIYICFQVQILHRPSGIRVSCQKTRSLALNRQIARNLLLEKVLTHLYSSHSLDDFSPQLDQELNPGLSKGEMRRARMQERERQRRKKRRKKETLKLSSNSDLGA